MTELEFRARHARWLAAQLEQTLCAIDHAAARSDSAEQADRIDELELQLADEREKNTELQRRLEELGTDWEAQSARIAELEMGGGSAKSEPRATAEGCPCATCGKPIIGRQRHAKHCLDCRPKS